ncbi:hypothetical protein ADUPG1_007731, partial [Aduncisulcus paluster]
MGIMTQDLSGKFKMRSLSIAKGFLLIFFLFASTIDDHICDENPWLYLFFREPDYTNPTSDVTSLPHPLRATIYFIGIYLYTFVVSFTMPFTYYSPDEEDSFLEEQIINATAPVRSDTSSSKKISKKEQQKLIAKQQRELQEVADSMHRKMTKARVIGSLKYLMLLVWSVVFDPYILTGSFTISSDDLGDITSISDSLPVYSHFTGISVGVLSAQLLVTLISSPMLICIVSVIPLILHVTLTNFTDVGMDMSRVLPDAGFLSILTHMTIGMIGCGAGLFFAKKTTFIRRVEGNFSKERSEHVLPENLWKSVSHFVSQFSIPIIMCVIASIILWSIPGVEVGALPGEDVADDALTYTKPCILTVPGVLVAVCSGLLLIIVAEGLLRAESRFVAKLCEIVGDNAVVVLFCERLCRFCARVLDEYSICEPDKLMHKTPSKGYKRRTYLDYDENDIEGDEKFHSIVCQFKFSADEEKEEIERQSSLLMQRSQRSAQSPSSGSFMLTTPDQIPNIGKSHSISTIKRVTSERQPDLAKPFTSTKSSEDEND